MPDFMDTWLITYSSPCSTTCGLGLRTQELCPLEATQANGTACHVRQVLCLDSWQCGLQTQTVAAGQHLELDCLEEVMEVLGPFSLMVSWRFARGVITTDENLFVRLEVPGLDRVVLDPVREKDAGTYCCDVQDSSFRRVKRMYKGVKVILPHVLSLDYTKGLKQWEKPGGMRPNISLATGKLYSRSTVQNMVLVSIATSMAIAVIIFICLKTFSYWKRSSKKNNPTSDAHLGTI
ncbi:transmembrane protein 81 isoform X2 [Hoplias malabaricus]